jgi:cytochrome b6-f complex iron-sulfur subunit
MKNSHPTRREFCAHAITLATISTLVESCGGGSPTSPSSNPGSGAPAMPVLTGSVSSGVVSLNIDAASPLSNVGGAALVNSSVGSFLVARTGQDTFSALTAICTHEACTVTGFQSGNFVCPCHGSRYSQTGAVVQGPANQPLRRFTTQFANNVLTITV